MRTACVSSLSSHRFQTYGLSSYTLLASCHDYTHSFLVLAFPVTPLRAFSFLLHSSFIPFAGSLADIPHTHIKSSFVLLHKIPDAFLRFIHSTLFHHIFFQSQYFFILNTNILTQSLVGWSSSFIFLHLFLFPLKSYTTLYYFYLSFYFDIRLSCLSSSLGLALLSVMVIHRGTLYFLSNFIQWDGKQARQRL